MKVKDVLLQHFSLEAFERLELLNVRLKTEGLDTNEFREYGELSRRFVNKILAACDEGVVPPPLVFISDTNGKEKSNEEKTQEARQ